MNIFQITPSEKVKELATLVSGNFYLVGGWVRNALLGRECEDEDVCSALTLSELEKKLEGSEFSLKNKNKAFGTCKIVCPTKSFDYATFRREGAFKGHCPQEVEFISDLGEDASRRDFTINAIYYDILAEKIIDPFGGVKDLKRKKIRAVSDHILNDDGVRILRMLRLAGEYNFSIEAQTLVWAHKNVDNVKDITKSKVTEELEKLFARTTNKGAVRAVKLYNRLGVWKRVGFEVEHIKPRMIAKCDDKLMGFIIDVVDAAQPASISYFLYNLLENSGFTKKREGQFINIVSGYYDALNHLKNKQYFFRYFDNFPQIYDVLIKKSKILAQKYQFFYKYIISHKLVIRKSDLKIGEKDLKKHFPSMPEKMYDKVFMDALSDVFDGKCANTAEELLRNIGKKHYHKF